ncbi:MAG: type II secretion system major pseudopilin GspG [Hyphomonadaceae bacterium]|nr:type II secretion system major pseudopilin GspG [Hyphomonadaceae bacterium]
MTSKPRSDAGYTLTELLVVIVVLALIAAAVTPQILGRFNTAKTRTAQLQANTLAAALDDFFIDNGRYPTTEEGIDALLAAPATLASWNGPYVRSEKTLIDPWNRKYLIAAPTARNQPPPVLSLGEDGAEGADGPDADAKSN